MGDELAAMAQAFGIDAMPEPLRKMPLDRHVEGRQALRSLEQGLRGNKIITVTVNEQHRWADTDFCLDGVGVGIVGQGQRSRKTNDCRGSRCIG